jgi:hypothetical protein
MTFWDRFDEFLRCANKFKQKGRESLLTIEYVMKLVSALTPTNVKAVNTIEFRRISRHVDKIACGLHIVSSDSLKKITM